MAGLDPALILNKVLFCIIMMTSFVLDNKDTFTQAPCNEVCSWAHKISRQIVEAFSGEQRFKCIATLNRKLLPV